jgi:hypothetical protein
MSVSFLARFRTKLLASLATLAALTAIAPAHAQVWPHSKPEWSEIDEARFSSWVETATVGEPETLFQPGRPLEILGTSPVDCADFVYALRIIFASQNGLPFQTRVKGLANQIDSRRTTWNNLPPQERLKAFLKLAFRELSTRTLPVDTYPVEGIKREAIVPGVILLASPAIGHSWVVRKIRDTGIPELVFGSVPDRTEVYFHRGLPRGESVFGRGSKFSGDPAGFRTWNHRKRGNQQARIEVSNWRATVLKQLSVRPESLAEAIDRQLKNICGDVKNRVGLVLEAHALRQNGCLKPRDQYDYSTPNRDSRLKEGFLDLWDLWMTANEFVDDSRAARQPIPRWVQPVLDKIDQVYSNRVLNPQYEDIVCEVEVEAGITLSLRDIRASTIGGRLSVDPNESIRARWGLESETGHCRFR